MDSCPVLDFVPSWWTSLDFVYIAGRPAVYPAKSFPSVGPIYPVCRPTEYLAVAVSRISGPIPAGVPDHSLRLQPSEKGVRASATAFFRSPSRTSRNGLVNPAEQIFIINY